MPWSYEKSNPDKSQSQRINQLLHEKRQICDEISGLMSKVNSLARQRDDIQAEIDRILASMQPTIKATYHEGQDKYTKAVLKKVEEMYNDPFQADKIKSAIKNLKIKIED